MLFFGPGFEAISEKDDKHWNTWERSETFFDSSSTPNTSAKNGLRYRVSMD